TALTGPGNDLPCAHLEPTGSREEILLVLPRGILRVSHVPGKFAGKRIKVAQLKGAPVGRAQVDGSPIPDSRAANPFDLARLWGEHRASHLSSRAEVEPGVKVADSIIAEAPVEDEGFGEGSS